MWEYLLICFLVYKRMCIAAWILNFLDIFVYMQICGSISKLISWFIKKKVGGSYDS